MSGFVFIDVQDKSERTKSRARHHAALVVHRRKRSAPVLHRQERADIAIPSTKEDLKRTSSSSAERSTVEDGTAAKSNSQKGGITTAFTRSLQRTKHKDRGDKALVHRWRVGAPVKIKPPSDDLKIEFVLSESFNWMMGQYTFPWSPLVRLNPDIFDTDNQLEIFRESFYIVCDLVEMGKVNAAFIVLRHALDAVPQLLREPHPELLFSLVELAYGISLGNSPALHARIKPHVAEMASVMLGAKHPLTVLLKSEFDVTLKTHVTELVFRCIIDTLSKTFGDNAYQTLVQQFGRSQFYARTGRGVEGQRLMADLLEQWKQMYGPDSILSRLAELELNLMCLQQYPWENQSLQAQVNNAMLRIEVMSGIYENKFTGRPSALRAPGRAPVKLALAQWFLQHKHYTFALHSYQQSTSGSAAGASISDPSLADRISDVVEAALRETLSRSSHIFILPSQAPVQDSVVTTI